MPRYQNLRQEPWEALCSFIISQNNNIPRIKGIIKRLCESFGEELESGMYTFPSPEVLSGKAPEDLASLRAGFRAKYIIDAANKVSSGEIDFDKITDSPIEFGRQELQKIKGVGKKGCRMYASVRIRKIRGVPRGRVGKAHNGGDVPGRSSCLYKGQRGHSSTVFVSLEAHGVPRKPITAEEFFMITDKPDIFDRIMSLKIFKWANPFYTKIQGSADVSAVRRTYNACKA